MHRDHKIGLALAVLLIGLAAALCFPRTRLLPTADVESVANTTDSHDPAAPAAEIARSEAPQDSIRQMPSIRPTPSDDVFADAALPSGIDDTVVVTPPAIDPQPTPPHSDVGEDPDPPSPPKREAVVYTIQVGDTLSGLAQRFLGSSARYQELFQANRDVLDSPDRLDPGVEIRIPEDDTGRTEVRDPEPSDEPALGQTSRGFRQPSRTPADIRRR